MFRLFGKWSIFLLAAFPLSGLLPGCGKSDQSAVSAPVASGTGMIQGKVFFAGVAPMARIVSAPDCPAKVFDETVVANPNGTLANVLVYLKDGPPGEGGGPTVILDQRDFHYIPHVLGLQVGQPLVVRNGDGHIHNVHLACTVNPQQNFMMMTTGDHDPVTFKAPEFFSIKCDVHQWMDCEVGVFDHPYFAVTGADGSFVIRNVPPGSYTLAARHERYGELTQPVTAANDKTVQADFKYQGPQ